MSKIELLVIVLVIGLMGTLSGAAVMTARAHTRDITRLAQVREIQMGLEMYYQNHSAYPIATDYMALGQALTSCLTSDGFTAPCSASGPTPYIEYVSSPPTGGLDGTTGCDGVDDAYCYVANEDAYRIQFELERANPALDLVKGANCATEDGLKPGACSEL